MLSGKDKGKTGTVLRAFPKREQVVVDGIHVRVKHEKSRTRGNKGQVVQKPFPIHVSNVVVASGETKKTKKKAVKKS